MSLLSCRWKFTFTNPIPYLSSFCVCVFLLVSPVWQIIWLCLCNFRRLNVPKGSCQIKSHSSYRFPKIYGLSVYTSFEIWWKSQIIYKHSNYTSQVHTYIKSQQKNICSKITCGTGIEHDVGIQTKFSSNPRFISYQFFDFEFYLIYLGLKLIISKTGTIVLMSWVY